MIDNHDLDEAIEQLGSILDMARWAVSRFIEADLYFGHGTDNPWDEAVTLIFHSLQLPHNMVEVTGDGLFSAKLTKQEKKVVVESIQKRVQTRFPLPYITNQAWFNGMPFYVDERVLIPRSPFAEMIESRFQPYFDGMPNRILDMCTGGGCIAIALAHAFENAIIDAVDISADALEVADFNIQEYQMSDRVFPIQSDLFDALQGQTYDLIVTNPPYVDAEDMADLPDEFQHEPELALASGEDGLDIVEQILKSATQQLSENGWCFVEVGNSQVHMEQRFPGLAVEWVELQQGGQGIFAVSYTHLTLPTIYSV